MSLQQIQREIQQEGEIDKKIDSMVKRILKQKSNNKYRVVSTKKDSDVALVFVRSNLSKYHIVSTSNNEDIEWFENDNRITLIYLKNRNPHDSKRCTIGDIKNVAPPKKFYE